MAVRQLTAAPHPLAKPGYGKVAAPEQRPRTAHDFARLPAREAAVAGYLDRLPDGSDISVKTLAAVLPLWGQCALRTALNRLATAGHLLRIRQQLPGPDNRWVTRTYFSRTPRDGTWWTAFIRTESPAPAPLAPPAPPAADPAPAEPDGIAEPGSGSGSGAGSAYGILSSLGRTAPALALSKGDCTALAPLLAPWLARGIAPDRIRLALTAGLPAVIHHPAAIVRKRLESKLPAEPPATATAAAAAAPVDPDAAPAPVRPLRVECAECGVPGPPNAFQEGRCRTCRKVPAPPLHTPSLTPDEVRAHAARIRERTHE